MRKALIASGVNINKDDYVHVLAKTASGLQTAIGDYHENLWYIPEDNYKINEGRLRTVFTENNLTKATYILEGEFDDNNHIVEGSFFQCFHVKSYRVQSGMIIYDLERDEWANEIGHATINDMVVSKCNRAISDGGTYPEPVAVKPCASFDGAQFFETIIGIMSQKVWDIAFSVNVTSFQTVDGTEKSVQKFLMRVHPADVLQAFYSANGLEPKTEFENSLVKACRCVAGIFTTQSDSVLLRDLPAVVEGIWLIPYAEYSGDGFSFFFKAPYLLKTASSSITDISLKAYLVGSSFAKVTLPVSDKIGKNALLDNKVFIGTKINLHPLPRTISQPDYDVVFSYSPDGVEVTAQFGTENVDLTQDFTMPLLTVVDSVDALQRIAGVISNTANAMKNVIRVSYGSPFWSGMGIAGLGQNITDVTGISAKPTKERITSRGNAIDAFELNSGSVGGYFIDAIYSPFRYFLFPSYENEQERAWREGADFNVNASAKETPTAENNPYVGMGYITSCPHLGKSYYGAPEENETYIRASVKVRGANSVASDFITSEFARGIYVKIY